MAAQAIEFSRTILEVIHFVIYYHHLISR